MGCCISSEDKSTDHGKPFNRQAITWHSETPLTRSELLQKRNTFWDTAPFYEGRPEIWQALQAATETDDLTLAQSILDAANIKLPTGNPADGCYDELGNRYVIPDYCLVDPSNLKEDESSSMIPPMTPTSPIMNIEPDDMITSTMIKGHQRTLSRVSAFELPDNPRISRISAYLSPPTSTEAISPGDYPIVVRLSTGKDLPLKINKQHESVPTLRARIYADAHAQLSSDTHLLRLIYLGKVLDEAAVLVGTDEEPDDNSTPPAYKSNQVPIRPGGVLQALVVEKKPTVKEEE
ncbi:hypothetical protein DM01DRAFT_1408825 [Hesseltinella vesiculosa]|uniref:DC-UbP/UBTD2 N-terminal domain-containing protein n=1 Tax=Hesseltinella vesiculosa TaxID=101127 RepID=A0A1X2GCN1_9FUNG|nr:hypothetical protein DM01DRAFT_1408825 [Hesseltinella vesiculosa]